MTFLHNNVGPQKGIFTAPKKQEQDAQQLQEKQKQLQKVLKPTSQGKPRKKVKSELHQEVSEFNPSGQMSIEQLIKVKLNLQKKVRKLWIENSKMSEQIQHGLQDTLVLIMANQEREHITLWQHQQGQNKQTNLKCKRFMTKMNRLKTTHRNRRAYSPFQICQQTLGTDKNVENIYSFGGSFYKCQLKYIWQFDKQWNKHYFYLQEDLIFLSVFLDPLIIFGGRKVTQVKDCSQHIYKRTNGQ